MFLTWRQWVFRLVRDTLASDRCPKTSHHILGAQRPRRGSGDPHPGGHTETVAIAELGPDEAAPVLKRYVTEIPITRPFFDVKLDSPLEAFVAEAHRHPVFRIHGASA
jgi:hypothetical protein